MSYTDVQICNRALGLLGDAATVSSISAPTTQQERWCATFYPLARDVTLEKHAWDFATTRDALVASAHDVPSTWQYAYAVPTDMIDLLGILDPNADSDYVTGTGFNTVGTYTAPIPNLGIVTTNDFVIETDEASGDRMILCNVEDAVARYTVAVTDTNLFSALFVEALAFRLASYLAGPLLKGDVGVKVAGQMEAMADKKLAGVAAKDANSRQVTLPGNAPWITNR